MSNKNLWSDYVEAYNRGDYRIADYIMREIEAQERYDYAESFFKLDDEREEDDLWHL